MKPLRAKLTENEICLASIFESLRKTVKDSDDQRQSLYKPNLHASLRESTLTLHHIHFNLLCGVYRDKYWDFIRDVTKALKFFVNIFDDRSVQCRKAKKFFELFSSRMEIFMKSKGYCCGTWHTNEAKDLNCTANNELIQDDCFYYRYEDWLYCEKCFAASTGAVKIEDDLFVEKKDFKEYKFVAESDEEFVTCVRCQREFHERCVLHIRHSGAPYYCNNCRIACNFQTPKLKLCAKDLPETECDWAMRQYLSNGALPCLGRLVIRLVSNAEKSIEMKKSIAKHRRDGNERITFNNCTLLVFFKTSSGREICFYGIYFQLYSNKCAYLSYIDSVNLFNKNERTMVYQQILIALFNYLKFKGYSKIFIWSCPPKKIDYIFYGKPSNMKIPSSSMLSEWYRKLISLAQNAGVVSSFVGVHQYAHDNNWKDLNNIPYFDGDLWPIRVNEAVRDVGKLAKVKPDIDVAEKIWQILQIQTNHFNDKYFILNLKTTRVTSTLPPLINSNFVKDRSSLLDYLWNQNLEFSNDRLAAFSTYFLLFALFCGWSICQKCKQNARVNIFFLCKSCHEGTQYNFISPQPKITEELTTIFYDERTYDIYTYPCQIVLNRISREPIPRSFRLGSIEAANTILSRTQETDKKGFKGFSPVVSRNDAILDQHHWKALLF